MRNTTQLSFRERIELLENASRCLDDAATTVNDEVEQMRAAAKRFSERRGTNDKRRAR